MLKIVVPASEQFDNATQTFINTKEQALQLEHSLVSLSKWESTWNIPFLGREPKTDEQIIDYIRTMTLNEVPREVFYRLSEKNYNEINEYINSKQTATWFNEEPNRPTSREIVTSELIHYWMISLQVPQEYQFWHINRLFTLIRVLNHKNQPKKKQGMTQSAAAQRRALNEARQQKYNTAG